MADTSKASKRDWQDLGIHGELNWEYRIGPFVLGRCHYPPNSYLHAHTHQERCLSIVERGVVLQFSGLREEVLCEGIVGFHPQSLSHRNYVADSGATVMNISICEDWKLRRSNRFENGFRSFFVSRKRLDTFLEIFQSIRQEKLGHLHMEEMIRAISLSSSSSLIRPERPGKLAELAKQIIREYLPVPLSLSGIATQLKVHPSHLAREFRRAFGVSIGQYVRIVKLDMACQSLLNSANSIASIATASGFSDQSDLTRFMKRTIGLTPQKFRDQYLGVRQCCRAKHGVD